MYNILKLKLKSGLKTFTKDTSIAFRIMIVGFILISAILIIKYKTAYEVKINNETIGYISDIKSFQDLIKENITQIQEDNIDSVLLKEEPKYEKKLIIRSRNTDEEEILNKLKEEAITVYKFYAVTLNEENKAYVDTLEEAENVIKTIKEEYSNNDLELNLAINEIYTQNKDEITIDTIQVAASTVEERVEELIDEKEAAEAIATINGINFSVLPVSGRITSRFGDISSIRKRYPHTGLDIACSKGTDIKVVADGTVVFAGWGGSLGNVVKIDHGNNVQTWYAHCSKIYVSEGDKVSSGDVISAVGSTGNSTGPHLHFEIRIEGKAVNPQTYVY